MWAAAMSIITAENKEKLAESCFKFYCDGMAFSKIAETVGIAYATVRKYLYEYYNIRPVKRLKEPKHSVCTRCHQTPTKRDKGQLTRKRVGIIREYYTDKKGHRQTIILDEGTVEWLCSRPGCLFPVAKVEKEQAELYAHRGQNRMEVPANIPTF